MHHVYRLDSCCNSTCSIIKNVYLLNVWLHVEPSCKVALGVSTVRVEGEIVNLHLATGTDNHGLHVLLLSQKDNSFEIMASYQSLLFFSVALAGCSTHIRADCGGENSSIAACQMLLCHQHRDHYAPSNSFVFRSSIRNTVSAYFQTYM